MANMSSQPLWLTHFIEILLVLEFQLTKFIVGAFSYKAHFRPQISSNASLMEICMKVCEFIIFHQTEGRSSEKHKNQGCNMYLEGIRIIKQLNWVKFDLQVTEPQFLNSFFILCGEHALIQWHISVFSSNNVLFNGCNRQKRDLLRQRIFPRD